MSSTRSRFRSRSKTPSNDSQKKKKPNKVTLKKRQSKLTDYYKRKPRAPSFNTIYKNRHLLPGTWKRFVEFYYDPSLREKNKIILFYGDSDEQFYDDKHMLDMNKPLTDSYLEKLDKGHDKWIQHYTNSIGDQYENLFDDSHKRFSQMKRLPVVYNKYYEGRTLATSFIRTYKLPHDVSDYINTMLEKSKSK
jgi:hypothetical protein